MTTAPVTFTESEFASFANAELGALAGALCLKSPADYAQVIADTLLELNVASLALISGPAAVRKARAFARVYLWRMAARRTAGDFDFSADGGRYDREQVYKHCMEQAEIAESEAAAFGFAGVARGYVDEIVQRVDPYAYRTIEEWAS